MQANELNHKPYSWNPLIKPLVQFHNGTVKKQLIGPLPEEGKISDIAKRIVLFLVTPLAYLILGLIALPGLVLHKRITPEKLLPKGVLQRSIDTIMDTFHSGLLLQPNENLPNLPINQIKISFTSFATGDQLSNGRSITFTPQIESNIRTAIRRALHHLQDNTPQYNDNDLPIFIWKVYINRKTNNGNESIFQHFKVSGSHSPSERSTFYHSGIATMNKEMLTTLWRIRHSSPLIDEQNNFT